MYPHLASFIGYYYICIVYICITISRLTEKSVNKMCERYSRRVSSVFRVRHPYMVNNLFIYLCIYDYIMLYVYIIFICMYLKYKLFALFNKRHFV